MKSISNVCDRLDIDVNIIIVESLEVKLETILILRDEKQRREEKSRRVEEKSTREE